jgi:hypothetical protein
MPGHNYVGSPGQHDSQRAPVRRGFPARPAGPVLEVPSASPSSSAADSPVGGWDPTSPTLGSLPSDAGLAHDLFSSSERAWRRRSSSSSSGSANTLPSPCHLGAPCEHENYGLVEAFGAAAWPSLLQLCRALGSINSGTFSNNASIPFTHLHVLRHCFVCS